MIRSNEEGSNLFLGLGIVAPNSTTTDDVTAHQKKSDNQGCI